MILEQSLLRLLVEAVDAETTLQPLPVAVEEAHLLVEGGEVRILVVVEEAPALEVHVEGEEVPSALVQEESVLVEGEGVPLSLVEMALSVETFLLDMLPYLVDSKQAAEAAAVQNLSVLWTLDSQLEVVDKIIVQESLNWMTMMRWIFKSV